MQHLEYNSVTAEVSKDLVEVEKDGDQIHVDAF